MRSRATRNSSWSPTCDPTNKRNEEAQVWSFQIVERVAFFVCSLANAIDKVPAGNLWVAVVAVNKRLERVGMEEWTAAAVQQSTAGVDANV